MNYDQPLLQESDTYETMLARVTQRSGCLDTIIDTCFSMIDVGDGPASSCVRVSDVIYGRRDGMVLTLACSSRMSPMVQA